MTASTKKEKSNRVNVACERCRKRHIRCDGLDTCSNCQKTNSDCVYVEGDKKIVVSLKYIQNLQEENARLKNLNGLSSATTSTTAAAQSRPIPATATNSTNSNSDLEPANKKSKLLDGKADPRHTNPASQHVTGSSNAPATHQPAGSSKDKCCDPHISIPSVDKAVPSRNISLANMFQGTSSLSMFGLEIKDIIPHGPSCQVDFNELGSESVDNKSQHCKVVRNGNYVQCSLTRSHGREMKIEFMMPSYEYALACHDIFNTYLASCFYFFNIGDYKRRLYQTYFQPEPETYTRRDIFWYAKLMLVTGVGEIYLGQKTGDPVERYPGLENYPGMYYFDRAGDVLNLAFDGRHQFHGYDVEAVEVILLYAFFHQMIHSPNGYYILSGLCLRCALVLGMHVEKRLDFDVDTNGKEVDCSVLEHRRRLWWTIYNMDRYLSAKSGFPLSIPDESIVTALPTDRDGISGNFRYTDFPNAQYINCFIKVTQISSNMLLQLYQPSCVSSKNVLAIISSVMRKLFEWRNELPPELVIDASTEDFSISRAAANIYSEYHQCINLTVRPLLLHFVRKRILDKKHLPIDLSHYSENVLTLLNASLEASTQTIKQMKCLQSQNMFSTFGYLDREYVFSAASTLVMFNVAFGLHNSSSAYISMAFEMLTIVEQAGNVHVSHRISQLRNFIGSFDFIDPVHHQQMVTFGGDANGNGVTAQNHNQHQNSNSHGPHPTQQHPQVDLSQQPLQANFQPHQQQYSQYIENHQNQSQNQNQNQNQNLLADDLFSQAQPYEPDLFGGRDSAERDLWDEIKSQGFWLGNVSDEFMNMMN